MGKTISSTHIAVRVAGAGDGLRFAEAVALRSQGMDLQRQGDYAASLDRITQALHLFQECDNSQQAAWTMQNQGLVLEQLGRRDEALGRFEAATSVFRASNDLQGWPLMFRRRGDCLRRGKDLEAAGRAYEAALKAYVEHHDPNGIINTRSGLGALYLDLKRPHDALGMLTESAAMLRAYHRKGGEYDFLLFARLARTCAALGLPAATDLNADQARAIADQAGLRSDRSNPDVISECAALIPAGDPANN